MPTAMSGNSRNIKSAAYSSADATSSSSPSSTRGQTIYACLPCFTSLRIKSYTPPRIAEFRNTVFTGFLDGGSSSIIEMSRSPKMISPSVLGIGVALITSRCGLLPLPRSFALCATPNLCCSSVTASARFLNSVLSVMRACVPITISIEPSASDFLICFFSDSLSVPVSRPTLISVFSKSF